MAVRSFHKQVRSGVASVASTDHNLGHFHAAMRRSETSATPQHTLTLFRVCILAIAAAAAFECGRL